MPAEQLHADEEYMARAFELARRGRFTTTPNPNVGCVIVRDGEIVGEGYHLRAGEPHAEVHALRMAGDRAKGATAYVTLEPCSHHGRTPPCADALVAAGVARLVSALEDPDPRVKGQGHARLKAAGIAVEVGEGAAQAAEINAGFLLRVREGRPLFHLKLASSLDGRIATASGESKWITGEAARRHGHRLRASHDAILVGSNTVSADDPDLTCRLAGLQDHSPVRIVLDSKAGMSPSSKLATTARKVPVWLACTSDAPQAARDALQAKGVEILETTADANGRVDVAVLARELGRRGLTRVLVEGGGEVAAAFLTAKLVDRVTAYQAGLLMGSDSRSAVGPLGLGHLSSAARFSLESSRTLD